MSRRLKRKNQARNAHIVTAVVVAITIPASAYGEDTENYAADAELAAEAAAYDSRENILVIGEREREDILQKRKATSVYGLEQSIVDTPRSVVQITEGQFLRDPINRTDDYVKYAPGITRGGGQNVSSNPFIRVLRSEVYQNGQRIYKDGNNHPLNLNAYEGADIVAGPSSVIFGVGNDTGGYINYLTKKPYFDKQRTSIQTQIGTWTPNKSSQSFSDFNLTVDTGGPITDDFAYRVSVKGQRGSTFYNNVKNNHNSFYGALSYKPSDTITIDWNGSFDDYYDFNISRGWNRNTQALVDDGLYYAGRATPIIKSPNVGLWSPVFSSSNPSDPILGWQTRTPLGNGRYQAGALQTTPLPSATAANAGTIQGWVYDPSIPGNELVELDRNIGSGRPEDKNTAKRYFSQLQVGVAFSPEWSLLSSSFFQKSKNTNDSVGAFIYQNDSTLIDQRFEFRGDIKVSDAIRWQSNSGVSYRRLKYTALSANNSFNFDPYDLTLDPSTQSPGSLYGLPLGVPGSSGSWIGQPGVPQLSPYFGYLNLPVMVPVNDGFYSEIGGFPTSGGAVYTSGGSIKNYSVFSQHIFSLGDHVNLNVGGSLTNVKAHIYNPVFLTPAQQHSDKDNYWLPSYQISLAVKPTADSTIYATYDRTESLNTGVFGNFLVWGPNNQLNPNAFNSVSELYEIGAKANLIPDQLFAAVSGFIQYRDLSPDQNGNIAKIRIKGIETSLRYVHDEHLSIGANGTYLDPIQTYVAPFGFSLWGFFADNETAWGDQGRLNPFPAGRYPLRGLPKYSLNGFIDYRFDNGFGAELAAWWTSGWYTQISDDVRIPSSYSINTTFYYRAKNWDAAVRLINVTNQKNFMNALTGAGFLQPIEPFSVQVQLGTRF